MKMYVFITENKVEEYQVGSGAVYHNNLVYANPTKEHLVELFGAKELVVEPMPDYEIGTQRVEGYYVDGDVITKKWRIMPLQEVTNDNDNN